MHSMVFTQSLRGQTSGLPPSPHQPGMEQWRKEIENERTTEKGERKIEREIDRK